MEPQPQINQPNKLLISDQLYRIEPLWVLLSSIRTIFITYMSLIGLIVFVPSFLIPLGGIIPQVWLSYIYIGLFIYIIVLQPEITFFWKILVRKYFHYVLEEKFLRSEQGVLTRQKRQLPYASVQNVLLTQTLTDRIFSLSTLIIQNAAQGGMINMGANNVPLSGNSVCIPGLKYENAQKLRDAILENVRLNQTSVLGV